MVLERAHRLFKQWLEKNNHADAHITGMERTLLRDWIGRLNVLYRQWTEGTEETRARAEVALLRLLLGEKAMDLDRSKESTRVLLSSFRERLRKAFLEPVLSEMESAGEVLEGFKGSYAWEVA